VSQSARFMRGGVNIASTVTWAATVISGAATITIPGGVLTIGGTEFTDNTIVRITGTPPTGTPKTADVVLVKDKAPPPTTGGSSGGTGGNANTQTVGGSITAQSNAPAVISGECVVTVGSAGTVTLTAGGILFEPVAQAAAGNWVCYMQWQWWNGSAWVAIGVVGSGNSAEANTGNAFEPEWQQTAASVTIPAFSHTNAANATNQRYRLVGWLSAGTRSHALSGSCNAQG
jgi:hypothetical protein